MYSLLQNKLPNENPFRMFVSDDEEMFIISPKENVLNSHLDDCSKYRALYSTVLDLRTKITYALENAIECTYAEEVQNQYNIWNLSMGNEWLAYYHIENAMFRVETLWDILAHFYNIKYKLNLEIHKVHHNRIFSSSPDKVKRFWNDRPPLEVIKISSYINENDDTNPDGRWEGNYGFINMLRNNMTHKFSISQSTMSSYAFELKHHPSFILKRLCESFSDLEDFINEVCESILEDFTENNRW